MWCQVALLAAVSSLALSGSVQAAGKTKIVVGDDDGWATAQMRTQYNALKSAGYDVIVSAPALNQSGKGSQTTTPTVLDQPCEFDTCPTGSPAVGSDSSDDHINYVNGFPVDAIKYGINTLAPKLWSGSKPDFVLSGPNIGSNLGVVTLFSGTFGAATEAALEGIPSAAISGASGAEVSFTTASNKTLASTQSADIYSQLTLTLFDSLLSSSSIADGILPKGVSLNVNYPKIDDCPSADKFKWALTRLYWNPLSTDVEHCNSTHLPDETSIHFSGDCFASISVFNASTKRDADADAQGVVLKKLNSLLTCP